MEATDTKISRLVEDYDLWCRMAKNGMKFAALPEPLVRYRVHRGGMKSSKVERRFDGHDGNQANSFWRRIGHPSKVEVDGRATFAFSATKVRPLAVFEDER